MWCDVNDDDGGGVMLTRLQQLANGKAEKGYARFLCIF